MKAQGSRIILYSVATPSEEDQLYQQLVEIGHTQITKLNERYNSGVGPWNLQTESSLSPEMVEDVSMQILQIEQNVI